MNDPLKELLLKARPPEWPEDHWQEFPGQVARAVRAGRAPRPHRVPGMWRIGFAVLALGLAFLAGFYMRPTESTVVQASQSEKVLREMVALFPNRIRSISITEEGMQLSLADSDSIGTSQPLLVKFCPGKGECKEIITFSGQMIELGGQAVEALLTASGDVLLVGEDGIWTGSEHKSFAGMKQIEARRLEVKL